MATSALIGALRVTLGMDSAAFEKGADRSIRKMDAVSKAGFQTGRALRGLAGLALTAGVALASVFTTRAVKDALDYAASIGEVASALGVTQKELQVYRFAGTQVNLTNEEIEKGLAKLTLTLGKAATGAKIEAQYFRELGIAVTDTNGKVRPTGQVLLDVADKLKAIPSPAQRAAAVYSLFGRAGQKLIPLLEGGSEGLKEFAKQAEAAGAVISDGDIAEADKTADKIEALTTQLKVNFSSVVAKNADAIYSLASSLGSLLGFLIKVGAWFAQNPQVAGALFGGAVGLRFGGVAGGLAGAAAGFFLAPKPTRTSKDIQGEIDALKKRGPVVAGGKPGILGELFTVRSTDKNSKAYTQQLQRLQGELKKTQAAEKAAAVEADKFGEGPDLSGLFAPLGGGGGKGKSVKDEALAIKSSLKDLGTEIESAFDTRNLPKSLEEATSLRQKLQDIADDAKKAGVPLSQFSDEMATLKTRIDELELEGLAKEAANFGQQVADTAKTVKALDLGALTPLEQRLADVDDRYEHMRQSILDQIEENKVLASVNADAAKSMERLVALLGQLDEAHKKAADAATAQYQAEQALRDLMAQQAGQQIQGDITDLQNARGDNGALTSNQKQLQDTERQLQSERINALVQLQDYEAQLDQARRNGDVEEETRLNGLLALQRQYYDLVADTTAQQIIGAQRLQNAYEDFTNSLSDELSNMIADFSFSLKGLSQIFRKLAQDLFIKPGTDALSGALSGLLQSFSGGHATGGVIPRGGWGIVGEQGPEPIFAGDRNLTVFPNDALGGGRGVVQNFNIQTPDADSFRRSERQIQRESRRRLGMSGAG